ncbi:uncharacterized protein LOC131164652 [Malania oleifera]|uniref:uncharacterized protein LOC131164652 n=1 Tax=Malania oleifera TaxID=397392 RepID=UPI0025AE46D1|nr:uncharacterized protein LOC131164652 [Malania oleifera]
MAESAISNSRYTYLHDGKWPSQAVDVHHVVVRKSGARGVLIYVSVLLLVANVSYLFLVKDKSAHGCLGSFLLSAFFLKLLLWKPVKKESVVVFPAFGVQLETHYGSGRVNRRFVPISKILKPVLIECVTPVNCYWSLSLILRGEEELMLVFEELRPPVKMLAPIWKGLCAAIIVSESPNMFSKDVDSFE